MLDESKSLLRSREIIDFALKHPTIRLKQIIIDINEKKIFSSLFDYRFIR